MAENGSMWTQSSLVLLATQPVESWNHAPMAQNISKSQWRNIKKQIEGDNKMQPGDMHL